MHDALLAIQQPDGIGHGIESGLPRRGCVTLKIIGPLARGARPDRPAFVRQHIASFLLRVLRHASPLSANLT